MKITKGGLIYKPKGNFPWSRSHAQVPFPVKIDTNQIRVFFSTRDNKNRSAVSFIDIDEKDPSRVIYVHSKPCLEYGELGCFDESGVMPSWLVKDKNKILLYYTGWNRSESASYRLAIGLAESRDNGLTFARVFKGPILERGPEDPIWVAQPCVLYEKGVWKMWYLACQKIEYINNHPEPFYNVKYATSPDGIHWKKQNKVCIGFDTHTDAIGRPCVWKSNNRYFMMHSNRKADDYRKIASAGYRLEMSASADGIHWRKNLGFKFKKSKAGWDKIMNEYSAIFETAPNKYIVFYNGYGFGKSGFGYFILEL